MNSIIPSLEAARIEDGSNFLNPENGFFKGKSPMFGAEIPYVWCKLCGFVGTSMT
jgi:hypothetical protein